MPLPSMFPLTSATADLWFEQGVYDSGGTVAVTTLLSCSRASIAYIPDSTGLYTQFANDTLRISNLGLLLEQGRTNAALWCRDLTNAAWTKVNITAALDQTGIDGTANSASSIVSSAANGTVLQTITLGSSARWQSAFVKRITGSGTINMTMDNGATWTVITVTGSSWSRVEIPTQTLANPIVGFRIVTNGDKIAVDFVQNENSASLASSPILTTTAAAARADDDIRPLGALLTAMSTAPETVVCDIKALFNSPLGAWRIIGNATAYGGSNMLSGNDTLSNVLIGAYNAPDGISATILTGTILGGAKCGQAQDFTNRSICGGGGTVTTDAHPGFVASADIGLGRGDNAAIDAEYMGYYRRITAWNTKVADVTLKSLTDPTSAFYQPTTTLFAQACM